jgi:hypothetical protein
VSWPLEIGALLPRAEDAYNVHEKLAEYSLKLEHSRGGPKAEGFAAVLGITAEDLNYLADALLEGARSIPNSDIRKRGDHGIHCQVIVPVRGLGYRADRVANVLTAWELRWDGDAPRLITAYIATTVD